MRRRWRRRRRGRRPRVAVHEHRDGLADVEQHARFDVDEQSHLERDVVDPIDPNITDENCDGTDGVAEECIYVSACLGDDGAAGQGTRDAPVKTIAHAIQVAQMNNVPSVCLSGEAYNEAVTVVSGISI